MHKCTSALPLHYRCTTVAQCTSCTSAQVALVAQSCTKLQKLLSLGRVASYYYVVGCPFYLLEAYSSGVPTTSATLILKKTSSVPTTSAALLLKKTSSVPTT